VAAEVSARPRKAMNHVVDDELANFHRLLSTKQYSKSSEAPSVRPGLQLAMSTFFKFKAIRAVVVILVLRDFELAMRMIRNCIL
jgi:hypothetical protein